MAQANTKQFDLERTAAFFVFAVGFLLIGPFVPMSLVHVVGGIVDGEGAAAILGGIGAESLSGINDMFGYIVLIAAVMTGFAVLFRSGIFEIENPPAYGFRLWVFLPLLILSFVGLASTTVALARDLGQQWSPVFALFFEPYASFIDSTFGEPSDLLGLPSDVRPAFNHYAIAAIAWLAPFFAVNEVWPFRIRAGWLMLPLLAMFPIFVGLGASVGISFVAMMGGMGGASVGQALVNRTREGLYALFQLVLPLGAATLLAINALL